MTKKTLSDMGIDLDPVELCKVRGGIDSNELLDGCISAQCITYAVRCDTQASSSSEYNTGELIEPSDPEPEEMFMP